MFDIYLDLAKALPAPILDEFPYAYSVFVCDTPYAAVGKFIDSTHTFAMSCWNVGDTAAVLKIYRLNGDDWKPVGEYEIPFYVVTVENLNADSDTSTDELLLSGSRNMNGNMTNMFFIYNARADRVQYAGDFFSADYRINAANNTMEVEYYGSWYMDIYKELILWRNDSMVPVRRVEIIISPKAMTMPREDTLQYLINPDTTYSADLKTVFVERSDQNSAHYKKYWDGFFDLK